MVNAMGRIIDSLSFLGRNGRPGGSVESGSRLGKFQASLLAAERGREWLRWEWGRKQYPRIMR
jgi:hypothetical protein